MTLALLFPGQGSQAVGMGVELADAFAAARAVFEEVDDALEQRLYKLMKHGPIEALTLTENAQPALMAVSLATMRVLETEFGFAVEKAAFVAGHSLGEYSALAAAGSFSVAAAARLLRVRGCAMQRAVPAGEGAMASLIGPKSDVALAEAAAAEGAKIGVCVVANDNNAGNVVISGDRAAVDRAIEAAKTMGARAIPLNVSAPFHCPLMQPAADEMAEALAEDADRAAARAAGRQRHRPAGDGSGDHPPPAGRAGHRPRALARERRVAGERGRRRRRPLRRGGRRQGADRDAQAHRAGGDAGVALNTPADLEAFAASL